MNLLKCFMIANECYQISPSMKPQGIVVHSTGANNPWLSRMVQAIPGQTVGLSFYDWERMNSLLGKNRYGNHWNQWHPDEQQKCVNGVIGKLADGSIATIQLMPWETRPWGCAWGNKGTFNRTHIQFEIMEDDLADKTYFDKAVMSEAVELCAYLCQKYGLEVESIVSHHEAHLLGYGSNHADIDHWLAKFNLSMNDFRRKVKEKLQEDEPMTKEERAEFDALKAKCEKLEKKVEEVEIKYNWTTACPKYAIPTIQKLLDKGILRGDEKGLGLTPQMLRTLVILDRAKVFD